MPLAPGDFSAVQSTADFHLDSLCPESQRFFDGLSHGSAKRNPFLKLRGNLLGLQLRVQFRLMNLLNRHQYFAPRPRRNVAFQLIDLSALAADDDAGP